MKAIMHQPSVSTQPFSLLYYTSPFLENHRPQWGDANWRKQLRFWQPLQGEVQDSDLHLPSDCHQDFYHYRECTYFQFIEIGHKWGQWRFRIKSEVRDDSSTIMNGPIHRRKNLECSLIARTRVLNQTQSSTSNGDPWADGMTFVAVSRFQSVNVHDPVLREYSFQLLMQNRGRIPHLSLNWEDINQWAIAVHGHMSRRRLIERQKHVRCPDMPWDSGEVPYPNCGRTGFLQMLSVDLLTFYLYASLAYCLAMVLVFLILSRLERVLITWLSKYYSFMSV